jgi:hypothetical protein
MSADVEAPHLIVLHGLTIITTTIYTRRKLVLVSEPVMIIEYVMLFSELLAKSVHPTLTSFISFEIVGLCRESQ